jgi:hypothetical protein
VTVLRPPARGWARHALVSCLSARWTLTSAASRQDVPGQEGDDDNRRRDSDDGDGRSGYDHTAILASLLGVETRRRAELKRGLRPGLADAPPPLLPTVVPALRQTCRDQLAAPFRAVTRCHSRRRRHRLREQDASAATHKRRRDRPLRCRACGAGLEPLGLRKARHTYVSLMHAAGCSLEEIGDFVGHSSTYMVDTAIGTCSTDSASARLSGSTSS